MVDPTTARRSIDDDVGALLDAAIDLEATVPACPDWVVRDLLRHTGKVHRWATTCLRAGPDDELERPRGPAAGVDPRAWFRDGADALLETLSTVALDAPVHTWAGTRPAAWWVRRITHETAIHRWDAESATGPTQGFAADVATDGVAELFEEFLVFADASKADGHPGSLHVHLTDGQEGAGEWYVAWDADGVVAEPSHRKADVALRAPASETFLFLWRRRDADGLDVLGDHAALERWRQILVI